MSTLGFEAYIEPLKTYLAKYREVGGGRAASSPSQRLGRLT